jgi:hypothetical protein
MSTLLERMIQRTRGPLSSLEPVATPTFAAVRLSGQARADLAGPSGPSGQAIADDASLAASGQEPRPGGHPDHPPDGRRGQRTGIPPERPQVRPVDDERAGDMADSGGEPVPGGSAKVVPAMPGPVMPDLGRPSPRRSTPRGRPPAANKRPDEDRRVPGPGPVARDAGLAGKEPHDGHERGIRKTEATRTAGPTPAAAAAPGAIAAAGPGAMAPAESGAIAAGSAAVEPVQVAVVEPGPVPAPVLPAYPRDQRPEPPTWPGQVADVPGEPGPEVTISIGHIEVRSVPAAAEEPTARPPFRPQVSLADFLGQDQGP